MYHLTTRTPEDWDFKITELLLDPTAFMKVDIKEKCVCH
jgi:hypothetical protein